MAGTNTGTVGTICYLILMPALTRRYHFYQLLFRKQETKVHISYLSKAIQLGRVGLRLKPGPSYPSTCHCATRFSNNLNRVPFAVCHVLCWALGSQGWPTQPLQLLGRGDNQSYHHRDKPKIPVLKESMPGLIKGSFRRFLGVRMGEKAQGSNFCKMIIICFMCLLPPPQYQESKWESC